MSLPQAIRDYYWLFGVRGVLLGAESRLLRRPVEVAATVAGIRYPVYLRLGTADLSAFRQVLVAMEYELELAKRPEVVVDAGAHIGAASVYYANRYPEARIIAIEPESSNFQLLKKNVAPYANAAAIQGALWNENKCLSLRDPGLGHLSFRTIDDGGISPDGTVERVRAFTLDTLMEKSGLQHIDILKVDIEGSEKEVFQEPSRWINRVGVIAIELHDRFKAGCTRSVYSAIKDFEFEWRNGDTIFLLRDEYVGHERNDSMPQTSWESTDWGPERSKLPVRIRRIS